MKTAIAVICGLSALTGVAAAQSSRVYFAGYMGLSSFEDLDYSNSAVPVTGDLAMDNTLNFGGALGFRLNHHFRMETELNYNKADMDKLRAGGADGGLAGDLEALTLMMNGYYDFGLDWPVQPFVSAGAGFGFYDASIIDGGTGITQNSGGNDWSLVYQVGGGLKYRMSDDFALTGSYRFLGSTDIEFDRTKLDYSSHEFRLGLEYDLPIFWDMAE